MVGNRLLVDLVELRDLYVGRTVERLLRHGEALAHDRAWVVRYRVLLADEDTGEALYALGLSRVGGDEHQMGIGSDGVGPLEIQAGLERPPSRATVHRVIERRRAGRMNDLNGCPGQAEGIAKEV